MPCSADNSKMAVASRKLAAAEQRRARKAAREPRSRLNSDSIADKMPLMQAPKGILKNSDQHHRIPTKRSVSECVDDLTQIMADLNLSFESAEFCRQLPQLFDEEEEDDDGEFDEEENCENCSHHNKNHHTISGIQQQLQPNNLKKCDCNNSNPTSSDSNDRKPKKSVRFNEHVYETFFFASRLYDRRQMAKYHFSSRHHPPSNQHHHNQNKQSKKARQRSESESHETNTGMSLSILKSDTSNNQCKLSKSQRAKQSKKDKKKNSHKKEDSNDTSSDDQGYSSSHYSISD